MDFNYHRQSPSIKDGGSYLVACVILHIMCVKAGGFHWDVKEFLNRFGIDSVVSVVSGMGSIGLAVIMGKHYFLRNKLLKKELKDAKGKDEKSATEKEAEKDSL